MWTQPALLVYTTVVAYGAHAMFFVCAVIVATGLLPPASIPDLLYLQWFLVADGFAFVALVGIWLLRRTRKRRLIEVAAVQFVEKCWVVCTMFCVEGSLAAVCITIHPHSQLAAIGIFGMMMTGPLAMILGVFVCHEAHAWRTQCNPDPPLLGVPLLHVEA